VITPPPLAGDSANLSKLTTPVEVEFRDGRTVQGSGFFYLEYKPIEGETEGLHWHDVTHMYLVTAKHVIQPNRLGDIVRLTYALRVGDGDHTVWHRLNLDGKTLGMRLHLCKKEATDVAVVDIYEQWTDEMKKSADLQAHFLGASAVSPEKFPGRTPAEIQPGDDVMVIGYPLGMDDPFNKLPIFKRGLLNTPIGMHFDGKDAFLFDFKYYDGASGSLIIAKSPQIFVTKEGKVAFSNYSDFVFLGVYEGEEYRTDDPTQRPDLGLGWYYYNVEEAIGNPPFSH